MVAVTSTHMAVLISEIIRLTTARSRLIIKNLICKDEPGFVPHDLPIEQIAGHLDAALDCANGLCSGQTGRHLLWQLEGVQPQPDPYACHLLQMDPAGYVRYQKDRLIENLLNQRIARRMLDQWSKDPQAVKLLQLPIEPIMSSSQLTQFKG